MPSRPLPSVAVPPQVGPVVGGRRGGAVVALLALGAVGVAQVATAAVLPALTRQLGLADWQAGAVTSLSAAVVVLSSPWWGRRADRRGPRPVLLAAVLAGALGAGVVAAVLAAGPAHAGWAWALLLLARGLGIGAAVAAAGPATQVVLVARSRTQAERVGWIARAGAVRGLATAVGAGLAAALAGLGTAAPVLATVVLLAGAVVVVIAAGGRLGGEGAAVGGSVVDDPVGVDPAAGGPAVDAPADPVPDRPRADRLDTDRSRADLLGGLAVPGVRAAVVASVAVFLALALVQGSVGFLVQDRYGLGPARATALTGGLLLAAGVGSMLTQGVLVPRLRWAPWRLVRVGSALALGALVVYLAPVPAPVLVGVAALFGAAVGGAAAGCTSAASVAVGPGSQGDVAGLVNAGNAATFVLGPLLATSAYGLRPEAPAVLAVLAGAVALAAAVRSGR
ncbi:MFS transporter [Cellulomonas sp. PS-H5]|uniref:MFS transporter n=1 Tax=Cellulomonas sp. PS-H5 TaxID=2820400 RepID=UPI001C502700|nr:MFS transporter [Cellulomonas sp. PS-H5]MBW0254015.1 MFS transporter [Cellulomonas sp. PS-H5]